MDSLENPPRLFTGGKGLDRQRLFADLRDVVCWCEHRHPEKSGLTLYIAVHVAAGPLELAALFVDAGSVEIVRGPILDDCRRALTALGYVMHWRLEHELDGVMECQSGRVPMHNRLAAIDRISKLVE